LQRPARRGLDARSDRDAGTYQTAWDEAEKRTYALNTARDGDGRACE